MVIDTIIDIKRKNFKSVLNYLRMRGDCQKKELAGELKLSFATVSSMINDMMRIGLVAEVRKDQKLVGRAPKAFTLCVNRYVSVVADIHHTQVDQCVQFTIVNLRSEMIATKSAHCSEKNGIACFVDDMARAYREFLAEAGFREESVIGVGIVSRGMFDSRTERVVGPSIS